jgi:tetratricopeptide (TPR) repeat protein
MRMAMVVVVGCALAGVGAGGCEAQRGVNSEADIGTRPALGQAVETGGNTVTTASVAAKTSPATIEGRQQDLLDMWLDVERIRHDRAVALYNLALDNAKAALREAEWDKAERYANEAIAIVEENRDFLWQTESTELRGRAAAAMKAAEARMRVAEGMKEEEARRPESPEQLRRDVTEAAHRRQVRTLREDARRLAEQRRFIEAIDAYKELLRIEPGDAEARQELKALQDRIMLRAYDKVSELQSRERMGHDVAAKESAVPYGGALRYAGE